MVRLSFMPDQSNRAATRAPSGGMTLDALVFGGLFRHHQRIGHFDDKLIVRASRPAQRGIAEMLEKLESK